MIKVCSEGLFGYQRFRLSCLELIRQQHEPSCSGLAIYCLLLHLDTQGAAFTKAQADVDVLRHGMLVNLLLEKKNSSSHSALAVESRAESIHKAAKP